MRFRCKKCNAEVPVPEQGTADSVTCPGCGARYKRKPKRDAERTTVIETSAFTAAGTHQATVGSSASSGVASSSGSTVVTAPPISAAPRPSSPPRPEAAAAQRPRSASSASLDASFNSSSFLSPRQTQARRSGRGTNFEAGDLLSSRYGIVRFVARGGMGEVYEAEDLELQETVALKTVRPEGIEERVAIERLKREIQLARKVTHPNVCRIFDVGHHRSGLDGDDVTFLTMEFLEGDTLKGHLKQHGPMSPEEALPLVCQMAEALHAAHRVGIVHRDFKSDNVMLVPEGDSIRAVVTDFGIARAAKEDPRDAQLTGRGSLVGTPAYMAPEQVSGEAIGPAADQYALGCVLFEMMTGRVPFLGDSAINTAAMRLSNPPPSPREYREGLPEKWEATILRCLERQPDARFLETSDIVTFLRGEEVLTEEELRAIEDEKRRAIAAERQRTTAAEQDARNVRETTRRHNRRRIALLSLLVVAIMALISSVISHQLEERPGLGTFDLGSVTARKAAAVLALRNASGRADADWLSVALSEMISTELANGARLRVIPGGHVARAAIDLALPPETEPSEAQLTQLSSHLGADYVVTGSYVALDNGSLRVDLRALRPGSTDAFAAIAENGDQGSLFDLVSRAGQQLRDQLDAQGEGTTRRANPIPNDRAAARLFAEGLERLRSFDLLGARELLQQAEAIEPTSAMVHSALATTHAGLGYQKRAFESAQRAFDLSDALPDEDRLVIEGQYRETAGEWERASEVYEALWRSSPDNLEYGLRFVAARTAEGRGEEALSAIDALRNLGDRGAGDPRIDLAEASAAASLSVLRRQVEAAQRARARAAQSGALLLSAEAALIESEGLRGLGRIDEARAASQEALRIYTERSTDRSGEARVLSEMGNLSFAVGDYDEAAQLHQTALELFQVAGDQNGVLRSLNNAAVVLRVQNRYEAARDRYEELLEVAQQTGNEIAEANALNNLGALAFSEGELSLATKRFDAALEIYRKLGNRSTEATVLSNLGAVRRWQGDLDQAREFQNDAFAIRSEIGQAPGQALSLVQLAQLDLDVGSLEGARISLDRAAPLIDKGGLKNIEADIALTRALVAIANSDRVGADELLGEAESTFEQLGDDSKLDRVRLAQVQHLLYLGQPEEATRIASELAGDTSSTPVSREQLLGAALLAEALLDTGQIDEAERVSEAAATQARDRDNFVVSLWVALTRSRVLVHRGRYQEAEAELARILSSSQEAALYELELRTRAALAEMTARRGDLAQAQRSLERLAVDADDTGHRLLAEHTRRTAAQL